ncbi:MAG: Crp/Fnr family transcriptional regulator [Caldilineaceae bacterium]|nr:Crp/Fnr family transcriptional regulator [Caldilineaceae bacterium]
MDKRLAQRVMTLQGMPLFQELNEADLEKLAQALQTRAYNRDEIIFRQGDPYRELYLVIKGKVRVYKISPGGEETTIAIFSTNDVIGELAALDDKPRSATGKAMSPVTLLIMSQQAFLDHMRTMPGLALGMARVLAAKLRWTAAYAESIAQFDAAGRLLHILLVNNDRYGEMLEPGRRYRINLGLTQSDLASMVGARREWVNRILSDWRRRGLVEFDRGVITILDLPQVVAERDSRIEANMAGDEW